MFIIFLVSKFEKMKFIFFKKLFLG